MISRRLAAATAAVVLAVTTAAPALAAPGGRIELRSEPQRRLDTRVPEDSDVEPSKVTEIRVGSGVISVWALSPEDVGTAVLHSCDEPAPTERTTFRLDPSHSVQYTRIFSSEDQCLSSTTPVHVIVDDFGSVSPSSTEAGSQYVSLSAPIELSTSTVVPATPTVIPRPATLTTAASAAVLGLEVLKNVEQGFVTMYGCNEEVEFFADLSYVRGRVANVSAVPIEPGEDLCVFSSSEITLRTTLLGELREEGPNPEALPPSWSYVPGQVPPPSLRSINPVRRLDTRSGVGRPGTERLAANETLELLMTDFTGPLTTAISMNVTATGAGGGGFLTVWPCTPSRPEASNLNFTESAAVPNLVVSKLSPDGSVCISASSEVHVIVDVNATYEADGGLSAIPVEPTRILDTRVSLGTPVGGQVAAGDTLQLQVTGGDVPSDAGAATLNVTATGSDVNGFVTVYPCDEPRPTASNLNFRPGEAAPNLVTTALSANGTVCLYTSEAVHLIADLGAWYGLDGPAGFIELPPTRVLDTRQPIGVDAAGLVTPTSVVELDFAETPAVAADADAVVMNVTAAQSAGIGFVTVWPCDQSRPTVSNLNIRPGRTVANLTTVKLSAAGTVCLATSSSTHLIADVSGYLTDVPVEGLDLVLGS